MDWRGVVHGIVVIAVTLYLYRSDMCDGVFCVVLWLIYMALYWFYIVERFRWHETDSSTDEDKQDRILSDPEQHGSQFGMVGAAVIANFQQRRARFLLFAVVPMLLAAPLVLGLKFGDYAVLGLDEIMQRGFGSVVFFSALLYGYFVYRCPACKQMPRARTAMGIGFNPQFCPNCGVRLK